MDINFDKTQKTGVDPGFVVGEGASTSDAGTFRRKCMRKRKNWVLLGWGKGWRPLDLPMQKHTDIVTISHTCYIAVVALATCNNVKCSDLIA